LNFIYFIEAVDTDYIKIGRANNPDKRLKGLSTGSPHTLKLLLFVPGGSEQEKKIHEKFAHLRSNGEWFRKSPELMKYINDNRKAFDFIESIYLESSGDLRSTVNGVLPK